MELWIDVLSLDSSYSLIKNIIKTVRYVTNKAINTADSLLVDNGLIVNKSKLPRSFQRTINKSYRSKHKAVKRKKK